MRIDFQFFSRAAEWKQEIENVIVSHLEQIAYIGQLDRFSGLRRTLLIGDDRSVVNLCLGD